MSTLSVSANGDLAGALAIALALAALHLGAGHLRRLPGVPERAMASFAGGLAVSYVFLHLLPEIARGNEAVGRALEDVVEPTAVLELTVFAIALGGFVVFYGLERLARSAGSESGQEPGTWTYRLHLGSFLIYNVLITYSMELRLRTGVAFAILFSLAMGLHFVLTDRGLRAHYPRRFTTSGRVLLAVALVLGWALSVVMAPTRTLVVSILAAFLGGSILLNVFKEELPRERNASFGWFLTGVVLYSALLGVVTAAEGL